MPANRNSPSQPDPDAAAATREAAPAGSDGETDAETVPMNRAERRAKGKVKPQQHLSVSKIDPHRASSGHTQRSYSNRRSGGGR
jgi:hypothetical protein